MSVFDMKLFLFKLFFYMNETYIKNADSCRYVWIINPMVYCFDDMDSHWQDRMIRSPEMLVSNIINIDNVCYMASYLFAQFIFLYTDIHFYHMTDYICSFSVNIQAVGYSSLNSLDGDSPFLQLCNGKYTSIVDSEK